MNSPHPRIPRWWLLATFLLALVVRIWRLDWQPLWWDEGYSVYFSSEPVLRMVWLTAHDIHPPLYYALLHFWTNMLGSAAPVMVRLFSILPGALSAPLLLWLGSLFFAGRMRLVWLAALLLSIQPMHLFYSQEVRMYALAMLLGIVSSALLWISALRLRAGVVSIPPLLGYVLAATLLLYTLYYGAFLLLAHAIWAVWQFRRERRALLVLLGAWLAIGLAYLPWLVYAVPKLLTYVEQKVVSDQDTPLGLFAYLVRHLRALLVGHIEGEFTTWAWILALAALAVLVIILLLAMRRVTKGANENAEHDPTLADHTGLHPVQALLIFVIVPVVGAFLVSLRLPFFPEGGERLLLIVLPFCVLLGAYTLDMVIARTPLIGWATTGAFMVAALVGVFTFYTVPRYVDEDYRPVLHDIALHSRDQDTVLAIFPWQLGYARAYFPAGTGAPEVRLLDEFAVEYSSAVEQTMANALDRGSLWFPEPLAFGSTLPGKMEHWLTRHAANLENKWYSPATRLSAWAELPVPETDVPSAQFDTVTLVSAGISSAPIAADNTPLPIRLVWEADAGRDAGLGVTLRLLDAEGRTWAARDYAPIASLATQNGRQNGDMAATELLGLPISPGIPPGEYALHLGVTRGDTLVAPAGSEISGNSMLRLGAVMVTLPATPPSLERLAMGTRLAQPATVDGLTILGYTTAQEAVVAGTDLAVTLFVRSEVAMPPLRELRLRLDARDSSTEWQGWSLPDYPSAAWQQGYAVTVPIAMTLPPNLADGAYQLAAAWVDLATGVASESIRLGSVQVARRSADFVYQPPVLEIKPAPQFGTHAKLRGYTLERHDDQFTLALTWEVLQPILPQHQIFVHALPASDTGGEPLAQQDGTPHTAAGSAPTGTWQPGEFLTTLHTLSIREGETEDEMVVLRVGLYEPVSQVRLPVTVDGVAAGDGVVIGE